MSVEHVRVSHIIPASPAAVWEVVSDLHSIGTRSPQCKRMFFVAPKGAALSPGMMSFNVNRRGRWMWWVTRAKIVTVEPEKQLSFEIVSNNYLWSYTLTPCGENETRVTLERLLLQRPSFINAVFTATVLGGEEGFAEEMERGMIETLSKLAEQVSGR